MLWCKVRRMALARHLFVELACVALCVALATAVPARALAEDRAAFARDKLTLQLRDARAERASSTRLWPLLTLGLGVSAVLTGTVVGSAHALGCEHGCSAPPWVSVVVVVGAAVGSAGAIWLLKVNADIREEDVRIDRLDRDLELQQRAENERRMMGPAPRPLFTLRLAF